MHFRLYPLRFTFVARDSLYFPPGKSGNILRGAFGTIFGKIAPELYPRMFEPAGPGAGPGAGPSNVPSGLADWPRPFVFRAAHLDGCSIPAGSTFHFDFHLFEMRVPVVNAVARTFAELAHEGLGPGRGRAELTGVTGGESPLVLALGPPERVGRVTIHFLTPTELKVESKLAARPDFGVLATRIRDRVSTLKERYDDGPLDIDFRAFGERAAQIRMIRCEIHQVEVARRSTRTGQVHSIGGFVGEAEYEGDLGEFIPYLRAAEWTGVGRQTAWGKGALSITTRL